MDLATLTALAGRALKNGPPTNSVLSYEGPFGVGYLISLTLPEG